MSKTENNNVNSELNKSINSALDLLKNGQFAQAQDAFSYVMRLRYDSTIAEFGIVTCKYWRTRYDQILKVQEGIEQGSFLFEQWQKFEDFYKTRKYVSDKVIDAVMYYIYSQALIQFNKDLSSKKNNNGKMIYMCGMAYKSIGDYNNALMSFDKCIKLDKFDCNALAQMADTYMLVDMAPQAKILFREAFSTNPQMIELDKLDCEMIKELIDVTIKAEPSSNETQLKYWLVVYGWLNGTLNLYRELAVGEVSKIKNEARTIERDIEISKNYDAELVARLLNKYFWLYDYYNLQSPNQKRLEEIEDNIKKFSYNIYKIFKNCNQEII